MIAHPPTQVSLDQRRQRKIVVLLVDDQPIIGDAVRRVLSDEEDIDFHYCTVGAEALATAEALLPQVIMQDLVMPDIDGMTLVHLYRMSPALQNVPIIVLSSEENANVKSQAFSTGASDYVVKLPESIELIARIRHHAQACLAHIERDAAYRALRDQQKQLLEMNEMLRRLNDVDGLTGLNNRRYLGAYLEVESQRAATEQTDLSLLMIDVDDFKAYNDTYGHLSGDEVLKSVAAVIGQCAQRPADVAARYGGEEFVLVLPATDMAGAKHVAEQLCSNVRALAIPSAVPSAACVTISIGSATASPGQGDSLHQLLGAADTALYEAKRAGKNRVVQGELPIL